MSSKALRGFSLKETPQTEPIPGQVMVANSAGGYSYEVDFKQRLLRFLILGSDGGTYYTGERELTRDNATLIIDALTQGGPDATSLHDVQESIATLVGREIVDTVVDVSESGRAPKNDPALFVLALCASVGTDAVKRYAFEMLPRVARIGTHLFTFAQYMDQFRGWGYLPKTYIAKWYLDKPVDKLVRDVTKYQQRNGWSHADLLRKVRPAADMLGAAEDEKIRGDIFSYVVGKGISVDHETLHGSGSRGVSIYAYLGAVEEIKHEDDPARVASLIVDHGLPREVVPTQMLNHKVVWEALLQNMPTMAMVRNLATMTRVGVLEPMSHYTNVVVDALADEKRLKRSRIHPVSVLSALLTYQSGRGYRGSNTWTPLREIVDALDGAFYLSFGNVEPMGGNTMLALDISGSMWSPDLAGVPGLTPAVGSAAMALVAVNVEKNYMVTGFTGSGSNSILIGSSGGVRPVTRYMGQMNYISELSISPRQRLDDVVRYMRQLQMGTTDCALPMLYATERKLEIDTFVIYTDSETYAGSIHPSQALEQYRQKMGRNAKMVVVGMASNGFTIADPNDTGQLDCVGFDTSTPNIISAFARGEV